MKWLIIIVFILIPFTSHAFSHSKPQTPSSFSKAKRIAVEIHADHTITFYCGCAYKPNAKGTSGDIDEDSCGIKPRKNVKRADRVEWEHIVPAYQFGQQRSCWKEGNEVCVKKNGKAYKGRRCCGKANKEFKAMEADLFNLVPAAGELNGDRSNFRFGLIDGEERKYGACNFEVDSSAKVAEPPEERQGEIARAYLYMNKIWGMELDPDRKSMYETWHQNDPVESWEIEWSRRIIEIQKVKNPFID